MHRFVSGWGLVLLCAVSLAVASAAWGATATSAEQSFNGAKRLLELKLDKRAAVELQRFITTYPDDPRIYDAYFMLGRCYQRQQLFEKALVNYAQVLANAASPAYTKLRAETHFQMGECYLSQKQYEKGMRAYGDCLKLSGKDEDLTARAQYWMAECQFGLEQFTEAKKNYSLMATTMPKHPLTPWAIYSIGVIEMREKNYDAAITALEQVTTQYKDAEVASDATLYLGYAYARQAQNASGPARDTGYQKAIALFTAVMDGKATQSEKQDATLALAEAYFFQKDYHRAETAYAKALDLIPLNSPLALDTRLRHAHALYNSEQYPAAAAEYAQVADGKNPELTLQAEYWQGNSWYQQAEKTKDTKAYLDAIAAFRRFGVLAGDKQADAARAALLVGFCLEDMASAGDASARGKAIAAFQEVIAKWPTAREAMHAHDGIDRLTASMTTQELRDTTTRMPEGSAWNVELTLARKEFQDGKYPDAIVAASKVLDGNPAPAVAAQANYLIGACQQQAGHLDSAVASYKKALAGAPTGELAPYALRGLIQANTDLRHYEDARDAAQNLTGLKLSDTDQAQALLYLANAYCANQQYAESLATYQQLVKNYPTSTLLPSAYMGMAAVAEAKKDSTEAVVRYREVVAKFPDDAELSARAFFHIGTNLLAQKPPEYTAAIAAFKNIPTTHKLGDQAAYAIAWAYADQGNQDQANTQFEQVAAQFPKSPLAADSLYRVGESDLTQKRYADAAGAFRRALDIAKPGELATLIAYKLGVSAFYAKDYTTAASAFDRTANATPVSEYAAESLFMKAQSLDLQGLPLPAHDAYLAYLAKYGTEPYALDAAVGAGRASLALKRYADTRSDLDKALTLYNAQKTAGTLAKPERARSLSAEAQFYLAESYYGEQNYTEAFKQFAAVPDGGEPWASRSLLRMARCSMLQPDAQDNADTHRQEAVAILQSLQHKYPASDAAAQAPAVAKEYNLELKTGE